MKSTDGHELEKNGHYYTRAGQVVALDDWAMGQSGPMFLACRFYEGEAMEAAMYPSGHTEITCEYEHFGESEPFSELFKKAPIFIVDDLFKEKSAEVTALSLSIGKLEQLIKESELKLKHIYEEIACSEAALHKGTQDLELLTMKVDTATATLNMNNQLIVSAEDKLGELEQSGDMAMINKDELGILRKVQFKLLCLEGGGVDNWDNYDDSLNEFRERYQ